MLLTDYSICTGCSACAAICTINAIQMIEDGATHFSYPKVNMSQCTECGMCQEICPALNKSNFNMPLYSYAANNKSIEARLISASGGIFNALATRVIDDGGIVAGVRYVGINKCEHHIVDDKKLLSQLCGTKYFQSESQTIYCKLYEASNRHELLMFCGTPCQVAAMKNYATINGFDKKLFTVEILCRGVSPAFLHQRFIQHLENKYKKRIVSIQYKEKSKGWNQIGTMVRYADGAEEYVDRSENYLARLAYELNLSLRDSCYDCQYKKTERCADITIGDFWGLKDSPLLDNVGTSFVMINTPKGEDLFAKITDNIDNQPVSTAEIVSGNRYGFNQVQCDWKRRAFLWDRLNEGDDIGIVTKSIINKTLEEKVKRQNRIIDRNNRIIDLYERWVVGYSRGENLYQFLIDNRLEHVAIFGFGTLGRATFEVIRGGDVCVDYIIETNRSRWDQNLCKFVDTQDSLAKVDAVIVTAINDFEDISKTLKERLVCPILLLEDIVP